MRASSSGVAMEKSVSAMSSSSTHFDTPEDAYFGFFEADRAKDADAWAAVMSYPHVRVAAPGPTECFDSPQDYAAAADWTAREATGWAYTRGRDPVILHESQDRVHLLGGWIRYNADDEPILWNSVTYIITRPGSSWGVQARFAVGSYRNVGSADAVAAEAAGNAAVDVVRSVYAALSDRNYEACVVSCRSPMVKVGVGKVTRIEDAGVLARELSAVPKDLIGMSVNAVQCGARGAVVEVSADYVAGGGERSVLIVGKRDDVWRIAGMSRMLT